MTEYGTIAHLIELAIQGERLNETIYQRLAGKFTCYPEVAQFWKSYAGEEDGHARWLAQLRGRTVATRLSQPADLDILRQAEQALATPVEDLLAGVKDLQDAYELANELEHSETNAVFEFLINDFTEDAQTHTFLRAQLNDHIGRLMTDFPTKLSTLRRGMKADD